MKLIYAVPNIQNSIVKLSNTLTGYAPSKLSPANSNTIHRPVAANSATTIRLNTTSDRIIFLIAELDCSTTTLG